MNVRRVAVIAALSAGLLGGALHAAEPVALKTTEFGHGPTIVFVHDLGAGRMTWMPLARKLPGHYHVVFVDLPGHGDSPMPENFTLQRAADALDQVMARQKPDSTVLVGHGVGGVIALFEASAHPERIKGLVVLAAAARSPMAIPDQQRQLFLTYIDEHYEDFMKRMYVDQAHDSAQGVAVHAQAALVPPVTMKAYLRELLILDATSAVKNLKMPMLYVGGEKNWPADQAWPDMAKKFGYDEAHDISWRRIGASGHYVALDQPDSVAVAITDFTARALAAPTAKQ